MKQIVKANARCDYGIFGRHCLKSGYKSWNDCWSIGWASRMNPWSTWNDAPRTGSIIAYCHSECWRRGTG